jgi:hypothetical protein
VFPTKQIKHKTLLEMSLAGDVIPKRRDYRVRFIEDRGLNAFESYDTRKAVLDVRVSEVD